MKLSQFPRAPWLGPGLLVTAIVGGIALSNLANAQGRPPMRVHTATSAHPLNLQTARASAGRNVVQMSTTGSRRFISANGIPEHAVGSFPNRGNPNRISAQSYSFQIPTDPRQARPETSGERFSGLV